MFAVPYRRVRIESAHSPSELGRRIAAVTQPRYRWFRFPPEGIAFVGSVDEHRVRLVPGVRGRNTYAPWILGEVRPEGAGTIVDLRMTLHPVAMMAVLGWFLLAEFVVFRGVSWTPVAMLG